MTELHRSQPSRAPSPPDGLVEQPVRFAGWTRAEPARQEWFIAGTQQPLWQVQPPPTRRAIRNPQDGAIYALDPDIPPAVQRLRFESAAASGRHSWWLDGQRIAAPAGQGAPRWLPWPGRHTLELRDGGTVIDRVKFEVRGAAPRRQPA